MSHLTPAAPTDPSPSSNAELWLMSEALRRQGEIGRRAAGICATYGAAIERVIPTYGVRSRAHYVLLYSFTVELFTLVVRVRHAVPGFDASALIQAYHLVFARLSAQFNEMQGGGGAERWTVKESIRDGGTIHTVYRYDQTVYRQALRADGLKVRGHVLRIDRSSLRRIEADGWYLYCIAADGTLLLYDRPLSCDEVLAGVYEGQTLVKHPMLAQDHGLAVRAAGDMWIVKSAPDTVLGAIVSRTSGHYTPGVESVASIETMSGEILGLRDDGDLAIIGGR